MCVPCRRVFRSTSETAVFDVLGVLGFRKVVVFRLFCRRVCLIIVCEHAAPQQA